MKANDIKKIAGQEWGHYKIYGESHSFVYNNFIKNGNFINGTANWEKAAPEITFNVSNGVATISNTENLSAILNNELNIGHKYIMTCFARSDLPNMVLNLSSDRAGQLLTTSFQRYSNVFTAARSAILGTTKSYIYVWDGYGIFELDSQAQIKEVACVDLTLYEQHTRTTIDTAAQFFETELGQIIESGIIPANSDENKMFATTSPFFFYKNNQLVSTYESSTPLVLNGIGTAKDYYQNNNGKVGRAIGNVDLGSLNWTYDDIHTRFWAEIPTNMVAPTSNNIKANMLSLIYTVLTQDELYNGTQNMAISCSNTRRISIRNTAYTNANIFKSAMSGEILYFEKITPTTEQANSVLLPKGITKVVDASGFELEFEEI